MPEPLAVLHAPAKLTRSLRITGVRADGYHLIEAEMVSLDLADRLVIHDGDGIEVVDAGGGTAAVPPGDDNLVARALRTVGRRGHVRIEKAIPPGAGLGGGSSDAAAILRWAGVDDPKVAVDLGADVPFCVRGGRARVTGVGEVLEPLPFEHLAFTIVTPPFGCDTAAVYAEWDRLGGPVSGRANGEAANDLEPAALAVEPRLARWRDQLGEATGRAPRLAGSGSTWFVEGAFPDAGRVVRTVPPHQLG